MPATTNRQTHNRTQGGLVLSLCFCFFVLFSITAQGQSAYARESYQPKTRTFHSAAEFAELTKGEVFIFRSRQDTGSPFMEMFGSDSGVVWRQKRESEMRPFRQLPWNEVTVIAGGIYYYIIGTKRGAIYSRDFGDSFEYFAGQRWLPDDYVTGAGFEIGRYHDIRAIWIETPKGYSRIEFTYMTLAGKAHIFEERVRARHVRHGLTADSHLRVPGDLSSNQMASSDNDGLWTAMYVAAECFRYKVTGEAAARDYARQGIQALMRLEEITGIPGFPARSFIRIGEDIQPKDGEWHTTPDEKWRWKGDTSSDEIVGHYYAYAIYYDLVADEKEKEQIRAVVDRITSHIQDHGWHLVDVDGKPTRWGWWAPEEIWNDPDETGLRALHLLSHLRVAYHITGKAKYQAAYEELISRHRYHLLTRNQKINYPGHVNHSDDELAFLSYYPLLLYENDPKLREVYMQSLERSWQVERPERNPLWNFIYAVGTSSKEFDRDNSVLTLQQIPMDLIEWTVKNSHRQDVVIDPQADRFKRAQSLVVLPYDELPVMKWNGNPYRLDGGNDGKSEDDGAFFLLPYWMGRYYKLIGE